MCACVLKHLSITKYAWIVFRCQHAILFSSMVKSQDNLESTLHGKTKPTFLRVSTSFFFFIDSKMCKGLGVIHVVITALSLTGSKNETSEMGVLMTLGKSHTWSWVVSSTEWGNWTSPVVLSQGCGCLKLPIFHSFEMSRNFCL